MQPITIIITPESMQDPSVRALVEEQTKREHMVAFRAKFDADRVIELRQELQCARDQLATIKILYQKQQPAPQAKPPLPEAESGL